MAALLVLLDKAIKPLLAAAQHIGGSRPPQNPAPETSITKPFVRACEGVFHELGIAA